MEEQLESRRRFAEREGYVYPGRKFSQSLRQLNDNPIEVTEVSETLKDSNMNLQTVSANDRTSYFFNGESTMQNDNVFITDSNEVKPYQLSRAEYPASQVKKREASVKKKSEQKRSSKKVKSEQNKEQFEHIVSNLPTPSTYIPYEDLMPPVPTHVPEQLDHSRQSRKKRRAEPVLAESQYYPEKRRSQSQAANTQRPVTSYKSRVHSEDRKGYIESSRREDPDGSDKKLASLESTGSETSTLITAL